MRWEESLLALFEDLEQQADGLHLTERDAEVEELSRADYAAIGWVSRLAASLDELVTVRLCDGRSLSGRVARVGEDWFLLESHGSQPAVVRCAAVAAATGLSPRSVAEAARSVLSRLPVRSALRGLAASRVDCLLWLTDGGSLAGRLARVGRDFVEVQSGETGAESLVRLDAIAVVRGAP